MFISRACVVLFPCPCPCPCQCSCSCVSFDMLISTDNIQRFKCFFVFRHHLIFIAFLPKKPTITFKVTYTVNKNLLELRTSMISGRRSLLELFQPIQETTLLTLNLTAVGRSAHTVFKGL
jgi:hypothetical protein